jgi:MarR family transcriptional regulator for hemolysin
LIDIEAFDVYASGMPPPTTEPIGLELARTAKVLSRVFDEALADAGGSLPVWLILTSVMGATHRAQRDLAEAVGVEGPTLTHHLNRMEAAGLVTRQRDEHNRRVQRVELTDEGKALFFRLVASVQTFDRRLRAGIADHDLEHLAALLRRLRANATAPLDQEEPR